jgi:hypothetical protein
MPETLLATEFTQECRVGPDIFRRPVHPGIELGLDLEELAEIRVKRIQLLVE